MAIYDINGKKLSEEAAFNSNLSFCKLRDTASDTSYTLFHIFKKKIDGTFQYPFVRDVNPAKSIYELCVNEPWVFAINASHNRRATVQNGIYVGVTWETVGNIPLTINEEGDFGYWEEEQSAVPSGIISAVCGWYPIIVDYEDYDYPTEPQAHFEDVHLIHAQRQIIGQYENGDYAVITCEGRGFDNSAGFTMSEAQAVCKKHGLKFAYNLDGGGSTQLLYGKKNVNHVYENETGRPIFTAIVFNGTNNYVIPTP